MKIFIMQLSNPSAIFIMQLPNPSAMFIMQLSNPSTIFIMQLSSPFAIIVSLDLVFRSTAFRTQPTFVPYLERPIFTSYTIAGNIIVGGTRWRSWLRHCATNRKVAGSIPDGVNGTRHGPAVDRPLTEISQYQEYFLEDEDGRCLGLSTLTPSCAVYLEIWKPQGLSRPTQTLVYLYTSGFLFYVPYVEKRKGWYSAESELMVILVRVDGKEFESTAMLRPPRRIFLHIQLRTIPFLGHLITSVRAEKNMQ
jgi:hypothetical protein